MYGTKEEKLAIGKRVHEGELTLKEAAVQYNAPKSTIRDWVDQYRRTIGLKTRTRKAPNKVLSNERAAYEVMTKEELIDALILSKANELRAKKGYEVKGVGANKEFITSSDESLK